MCPPRKEALILLGQYPDKVGGKAAILKIHDISRDIEWRTGLRGLAFP